MRRMSFALTTKQMRERKKWVTRRTGWANVKPGTVILAVTKTMGLKKGERAEVLGTIRVRSVRREELGALFQLPYGEEEMELEGFPGRDPGEFVAWLCRRSPGVTPQTVVSRIEFEHLDVGLPLTWPFPTAEKPYPVPA